MKSMDKKSNAQKEIDTEHDLKKLKSISPEAGKKAMAASLHEAYEAGRAHTATELKARMAAFFDGLVAESESHTAHAETPPNDSQHHDDHQHHDNNQHHD